MSTISNAVSDKIALANSFHAEVDGGALRVTTEAPNKLSAEDLLAPSKSYMPTYTDRSGVTRGYMGADGNAHTEFSRAAPVNSADLTNGLPGILGTARKGHGGAALSLSDMTPDTVVSVGGMELTLGNAERLGLVTRHPQTGLYHEPGSPMAAAPQPQPQRVAPQPQPQPQHPQPPAKEDHTSPQPFADAEAESVHASFAENVSGDLRLRAANELETSGEISLTTVERMASQLGRTTEEVFGFMKGVLGAYGAQARTYLIERGLDPAEFRPWAESHAKQAFMAAQREHYNSKNPARAYSQLVDQYLDTLGEHSPDIAKEINWGYTAEGNPITARKGRGGAVVLNIPGAGEMALQQARQLGYVI